MTTRTRTTDNPSFICSKQVQQRTGLNESEIKILAQNGLFPQSTQIAKRLLWNENEINFWIQMVIHHKVFLGSDLLFQFNFLNKQFNEASDLASLASRNLIHYGKKVKPHLKEQMDKVKDQLQLKLI